jgi:putative ABC transport system permease protein
MAAFHHRHSAALAMAPYDLEIRPRMEDYATVLPDRHTVAVIAIDVLSDAVARAPAVSVQQDKSGADTDSLQSFDSVWVGPELGRKKGDRLRLVLNDREHSFTVRGVLPKEASDVVVMDLSTAARTFGRGDALDRILVRTPRAEAGKDWQAVVQGLLPGGLTVSKFGARTDENRRMLEAFRWNLRVLSYIALIVGAFLIYNTISVSVVRRRPEIGIVRALGATRSAIVGAFLGEAVCFGLAGAAIGIALGQLLARSAVGLVA